MGAATAAGAAIGLLGEGYKAISGAINMREAEEALKNMRRQELRNAFEQTSVSTLGADVQREQAARMAATSVEALQSGGVRGVVGGLQGLTAQNQILTAKIAADLDAQQRQIDMARAQDEARIREMKELREREEIAGLTGQYTAGRQDLYGGITGFGSSLMSIGNLSTAQGQQQQYLDYISGQGQSTYRPPEIPVSAQTKGLAPTMGYTLPTDFYYPNMPIQTYPQGLAPIVGYKLPTE